MRTQSKRVTLYTTPVCPWCVVAKRYLAEKGVTFTEVDVASDRTGLREMVLMTAQHGVPVVRVGEKAMVGWSPEEFERLFGM
jgi:glutaredoxin 3